MNSPKHPKNHSRSLTIEQRNYVIFELNDEKTYSQIKKDFYKEYRREIYDSTISRLKAKKEETGDVADRDRTGRPRIYDEREERQLVRYAVKHPKESLRDIVQNEQGNPKGASMQTLSRIYEEHDVVSRVLPGRMDDLSADNVKARKEFAKTYLKWDIHDWNLVVFSDEADLLPIHCGKEYIRLRRSQNPVEVIEPRQETKRNLTIKVWGAVSSIGVGPLVKYEKTMKKEKYLEILKANLFQAFPGLENRMEIEDGPEPPLPSFYFMDDNARPHRAKIVTAWKEENDLRLLPWPANSPDLNVLENIWAYVEDHLYQIKETLQTPEDTWRRAQEIWYGIDIDFIRNLYNTLPDRIKELKKAKGGPIPY